jgi:CRISPR-associated protein Csm4
MTHYTRVRLAPRGPFHFGGRGVGMEHSEVGLPADSLFSALCITLRETAGGAAVEALLARYPTSERSAAPPFRLTSLMPYAAGVYFLPSPMIGPPKVKDAGDLRRRKEFKEIAWVSEVVFRYLTRGETPAEALDGNGHPITIQGGKVWLTQAECKSLKIFEGRDLETHAVVKPLLWRTGRRPRVTVDRLTSASAVYSAGATEFNQAEQDGADGKKQKLTAGLYTVIEWLDADDALRGQIKAAFEALGAAGIGGERSSGYGQFTPGFDELAAWQPGAAGGGYFTTLAPYLPARGESQVIGPGARYEITLRRGWLSLPGHQNLRRGTARMIADGSVLHWPAGGAPMGTLADVTPGPLDMPDGRRIYRYGLAFPVRIADAAMNLTPPAPLPCEGRGEANSPLLAGEGLGVRSEVSHDRT